MRLARFIELGGGVITALLGLALSLYVTRPTTLSGFVGLFSVQTCAALFVGVGAYAHAVTRNAWGRLPLWVGGAVLVYETASLLLKVPIGLYFLGRVGLFLVLPGAAAVVTLAASLFNTAPAEG